MTSRSPTTPTSSGAPPASAAIRLPALRVIVGRDEAEVERKFDEVLALIRIEDALPALARSFDDHDFSQYPLDAPFPVAAVKQLGHESNQSASNRVLRWVEEEKLTLREAALRVLAPSREFVGTPQKVADAIQRWFDGRAADGFVYFASLPGELESFVELVLPVLRERGLFKTDYAADTLRGHLGLPRPANRFVAGAEGRQAAEATA